MARLDDLSIKDREMVEKIWANKIEFILALKSMPRLTFCQSNQKSIC